MNRRDVDRVLAGLKDFQCRTVEYVFQRLYGDNPGTRRFLIADEVGLGKTLVARGVIARAIHHLRAQERITVVYVCSNAGVARQNIQRLNVTGRRDFTLASRVTLLPQVLPDLRANRVSFVSFTPGTSFDLGSNLGVVGERAVLYILLERAKWFRHSDSALSVLCGHAGLDRFRSVVASLRSGRPLDPTLTETFVRELGERADLRDRFTSLRDRIARAGNPDGELGQERNRLVGELRGVLARSCLGALRPDLIILDEFQRFKHLLATGEEESELSLLARDFFAHEDARILLLSATPYKMYTLTGETGGDDHYRDFMQTLRFLSPGGAEGLETVLRDYRRELLRFSDGGRDRLRELRKQLADGLRGVMSRTERAAAGRSGTVRELIIGDGLAKTDLTDYLALQRVARLLERDDTLEFWKSAPYLLNFMDGYDLERGFQAALTTPRTHTEVAAALATSPTLLLPWSSIRRYRSVDPGNSRLRGLTQETVGSGWWRCLWVPPTIPYYSLAKPFDSVTKFTKRLVFSAWKVVPKAIAGLLSYEAERQMIRCHETDPRNTPQARQGATPAPQVHTGDRERVGGQASTHWSSRPRSAVPLNRPGTVRRPGRLAGFGPAPDSRRDDRTGPRRHQRLTRECDYGAGTTRTRRRKLVLGGTHPT